MAESICWSGLMNVAQHVGYNYKINIEKQAMYMDIPMDTFRFQMDEQWSFDIREGIKRIIVVKSIAMKIMSNE